MIRQPQPERHIVAW